MRQPSLFSSRLSDAQGHTWCMSAVDRMVGAELADRVARVLIIAVMTYSREWTACEIFVCAFVLLTNLNPRWRPLVLSKDLVWASQTSIHKTANREREFFARYNSVVKTWRYSIWLCAISRMNLRRRMSRRDSATSLCPSIQTRWKWVLLDEIISFAFDSFVWWNK